MRGRYTGKYGNLDGRWLDFRANTVTGNVSVLHTARSAAEKAPQKRGQEGDRMTPPVFAHGHLRLYLLSLLAERPMHGYELIQALSDRFGGTYVPSAGTIYPRLASSKRTVWSPRSPTAARPSTPSPTPAAPSWPSAARNSTASKTR